MISFIPYTPAKIPQHSIKLRNTPDVDVFKRGDVEVQAETQEHT
jgi:hypothetical protein